jgi:hypothetical protein
VITTANMFVHYRVDPTLYLGLPRPDAPRYPFSGPSGGMGVFVSLLAGGLRAEYGHLDPAATIAATPREAFIAPFSNVFNYSARFSAPRGPDDVTLVARWEVKRGAVLGFVGNSGYSDVPHLHYQIVTVNRATKYCPSTEAFPASGWLFSAPR